MMNPTTERFQTAVAQPHALATEVVVQRAGIELETIPVTEGSVTLDNSAEVRGRVDLTIGDPDLVPREDTDLLAPYGNELLVSRGITYPEGDVELVPLGVFRIDEVDTEDSGAGLGFTVTGQDRAAAVSDAKFEEPWNVASGTLFTDAIKDVIELTIGPTTYHFADTDIETPNLVAEEGEDPWQFVQGLATALGAVLYFDAAGALVLKPVPEAAEENSVLDLVEGEDGVLMTVARRWSRVGINNRVIVTGENSDIDPPVRGEATDDNPRSPTYYYGDFGKVPFFWSNEYVTTSEQAQGAAEGILKTKLGSAKTIDFGSIVNPALEPYDVIKVTRQVAGITEEYHVVDSLTIPLAAEESMTGETRAVVTV